MYWTIQKSLLLKYETLIIWETWFLLLLFNHSIMSDFLRPQYAKLPCPSPFPRQCSNSCPESIQNFILCHPLLLLPSILPSIRVFSNESALRLRWQKYWTFSFDISPSSEYPGLISFRIDWLDLLAVQGTLKSLLQHPSLKTSMVAMRRSDLRQDQNAATSRGAHMGWSNSVFSLKAWCLSLLGLL